MPTCNTIRPIRLFTLLTLTILAACSGIPETGSTPAATSPLATGPATHPAQSTLSPESEPAPVGTLAATEINCSPPAALTPAMTEGPFYSPGSPERASLLEPGMAGTSILISGYVLTTDCEPVPNAWLDFWQTDSAGQYDNSGYRLRGHQFADENGRYELETVLPGEYPGRTMHIHVKVQPPGGEVLTTQLFFPGAAGNQSDRIFAEELLVNQYETEEGLRGSFNFILEP